MVSARASVKVTECMGEYLHGEINNEEMDHLKIAKVYYALTVKDLIPIMRTYYKYKRFARDMNEAT